ncbi:hypothetical protein JW899_03435 [Candidatus Uhrbacteria bacterium]|nr:hypothetical protein [Candidatus Uhrbacteria bacterium]
MNTEQENFRTEMEPSETEKEAAKERVLAEIAELDIGLNLEKHPEILDRLAEIGHHFRDGLDMARVIQTLYGQFRESLGLRDASPKRLMRTAVLHDIGKSGPAGEKTDFHQAVRCLFREPTRPFNPFSQGKPTTVTAFIESQEMPESESIRETLRRNGIDPDRESAIEFWRRHVGWSYDILKNERWDGEAVDDDMITIAGSHHILEGKNPAELNIGNEPQGEDDLELIEMTGLLAAVDKYQAFRHRANLDHAETMRRLRGMFESHPELPDMTKEKFKVVLDILDRSGPELKDCCRTAN